MSDRRTERFEGKSIEELLGSLLDSEPGSKAHEQVQAAIQVRIAEIQGRTADKSLEWARLSAISTAVAAVIAVTALVFAII